MIEFISTWAKSLGVTIVLVSIIEMLLPNNKTKKYIRVVLGVFVLFNIISPFIKNKEQLNIITEINSADLEKYSSEYENYKSNDNNSESENNNNNNNLNQTSMDERITELYKQELERSIKSKIEEIGYEVETCKVEAQIIDNETGIKKVRVKIGGKKEGNNENEENKNSESNNNEKTAEEKVVEEIEKIKKVDEINILKNKEDDAEENSKITKTDIQNIKNILKEEYGVSEDCLEIN